MDRRFRQARVWSNQELRKIAPLFTGEVVNVSAGDNVDTEGGSYDTYFVNALSFYISNYAPGSFRGFKGRSNEYLLDLEAEVPLELKGRFDVVMSHTVMEHVFDLRTAFRNLYALSKDIVIVIVPFAQMQHDTDGYKDYWRIAPEGLRRLFRENDLQVIYEACNDDRDGAVYLFFVGSRQADRWLNKIPEYEPIRSAADWIGSLRLLDDATLKDCVRQAGCIVRQRFRSIWQRSHAT
jgi:hypothetical protein